MIFFLLIRKLKNNLKIYKEDLQTKGLYWSVVDRLLKVPKVGQALIPLVNFLKPDFVMIDGHKIHIDKTDWVLSQELILNKKWEAFETSIFLQYLKPGDVVLDLGAHIGYYTLLAARAVGNIGKVYAFEPDPRSFRLLTKNVIENGYNNVILVNKAVTAKNENIRLYIHAKNTGDHRAYDSHDNRKSIPIQAIALDDFLKREQTVDLIKMDIQGSEIDALLGARHILKNNKGVIILTELSPIGFQLNHSSSMKYIELLRKNHFIIYYLDEEKQTIMEISDKELLSRYTPELLNNANLLCKRL